MYSYNLA